MKRILVTSALILVIAVAGLGFWGYTNFDRTATSGWSAQVRDRLYRFLEPPEEIIVLAPDDLTLPDPYEGLPTLTPGAFDWFTKKIPAWEVALAEFKGKPGISYLEVGAYEGRSLMWALENVLTHPTSRATVIDVFYEMGPPGYNQALRDRYDANVAHVNGTEKTETIVGFSQIELRKLPLDSYDIIYIDGSHWAPDVLEDAILAMRLLKEGGVLIFDDYRWGLGAPRMKRPKLAVDTFLDFYGEQYTLLHNTMQVIVKKTSIDQQEAGLLIAE